MQKKQKVILPLLFLFLYVIYTLITLFFDHHQIIKHALTFTIIAAMGSLVILYQSKQDEFLKRLNRKAYTFGFWFTFAGLVITSLLENLEFAYFSLLPMWSLPLIGWNLAASYLYFSNK